MTTEFCEGAKDGLEGIAASKWTGTWAAAPQLTQPENLPLPPGLADTTLRQVVRVSRGGACARVRFSNEFSSTPLTIHAAQIARPSHEGSILPETDCALQFGGSVFVTIPACQATMSDPITFPVEPLTDLAITVYVRDLSAYVTGHPGARCTAYLATGNHVSAIALPDPRATEHWYYISGIDVLSPNDDRPAAIAVLGDSLTDGRGSTTDGNGRWTDVLARRLASRDDSSHIGVLNLGLGGNRVCADGIGPSALSRLDRDVFARSDVRWLIVVQGINDLGTGCATAGELILAYRQIIDRAHEYGIEVLGGTLTPCGDSFYFSPELEAERQAVNSWIRTSGAFDAVIDFDAALRDPTAPTRLRPEADCGDHLHLNDIGYRRMAEAVDLRHFSKSWK